MSSALLLRTCFAYQDTKNTKNERNEEPWGNGQDSNTKQKMQDESDRTVRVAAQSQEIHKRTCEVPDKMHEMHTGLGVRSVGCVSSGSFRRCGRWGGFFLPLLLLLCSPCCGATETHKLDSAGLTGPTRAPVAQFPPFALGGPWQRSWLDGELHFDAHVPLACRNQKGCSKPHVMQVISQWLLCNAVVDLTIVSVVRALSFVTHASASSRFFSAWLCWVMLFL